MSPIYFTLEKVLEYPFGKAFCNEKYVFFEKEDERNMSHEDAVRVLQDVHDYYDKKKFVYISHRKIKYIVSLESYKFINKKQMLGIAIVSQSLDPEKDLLREQELFDGPFAFFKELSQAISWAETFDFS